MRLICTVYSIKNSLELASNTVLSPRRWHRCAGLIGYLPAPFVLLHATFLAGIHVEATNSTQHAKFLPVNLPDWLHQTPASSHLPSMTEGVTVVLMRAVEVVSVDAVHQCLHPREVPIGLVGFVAVARALRRLIVAENPGRLLAAVVAAQTQVRGVAAIRQGADFALRLNRVRTCD